MRDARGVGPGPIIIAAPFSPEGSGSNIHLGAANKIRAVIRILAKAGRDLILVDSAHNREGFAKGNARMMRIHGSQKVAVVTPFTFAKRPVGKLANLLCVSGIASRLARERPSLVWVYNGYAFDARLGMELASRTGCPIVLELEDWPTSRDRGLNPKPFIDLFLFGRLVKRAALVTCVNKNVEERVRHQAAQTMLMPGTLSPELAMSLTAHRPFSRDTQTLGYFGHLSEEKGADVVLDLSRRLPEGWNIVVTGSGPLREKFIEAAAADHRVQFHDSVLESELYEKMLKCDAIVNPHRSIASMSDGVFPFKVFEAIASGRLLISTPVPDSGLSLDGVHWFDGTSSGLSAALNSARSHYDSSRADLDAVARKIRSAYSDAALYDRLRTLIPALEKMSRASSP